MAIGVGDPHRVAAVDLDVLHGRVVHEGLQSAQAEQVGHDCCGDGHLGLRGPQLVAILHTSTRAIGQLLSDQRASQLSSRRVVGNLLNLQAHSEALGGGPTYQSNERGVGRGGARQHPAVWGGQRRRQG